MDEIIACIWRRQSTWRCVFAFTPRSSRQLALAVWVSDLIFYYEIVLMLIVSAFSLAICLVSSSKR